MINCPENVLLISLSMEDDYDVQNHRFQVRDGMQKFSMGDMRSSMKRGCYVSRCSIIVCIMIFLIILVLTIIGTYFLARRTPLPILTSEHIKPEVTPSKEIIDFRGNVNPVHYRLQFFPFLNTTGPLGKRNFTLYGQSKIFFKIIQKINSIEFHASGLRIEKDSLALHAIGLRPIGEIMSPTSRWTKDFSRNETKAFKFIRRREIECNKDTEVCSVKLSNYISRTGGIFMLTVNYWTTIQQGQTGIFYEYYQDLYNQKKSWYIATNLFPSHARRVFPCFDLPTYNSTFDISILRHKTRRSISNSKSWRIEPLKDGDWVWDHFERTRGISVSSIGFVVLDAAEVRVTESPVSLSIWSIPSEANQTTFVAHVVPKMLEAMENITSVRCPLQKLDVVILPGLFPSAGGWSLIFLDSTEILPYRKNRADLFEFRGSQILAQPVTHQWFLAFSNPSWSKMWIDSSLQLFLAQTLLQNLNSDWKVWNHFLATNKPAVMQYDSFNLLNSLGSANDFKDIQFQSSMFYPMKGVLIFLMLLGPDGSIKQGTDSIFMSYLSCSSVKSKANCRPWKLSSISPSVNSSGLTFQQAALPWFRKAGFPLVKVSGSPANAPVVFNQESILLENKSLWYIPIDYMTEVGNKSHTHMMHSDEKSKKIKLPQNSTSWIMINTYGRGYYRVNYSDWTVLEEELSLGNLSDVLPDVGKAQLIDDAFGLASLGHIPYTIPLNITHYLSLSEVDFPPWSVALYHLNFIERFLWDTPTYAYYRIYMLNLLNPLYEALKLDVIDFHLISELRNLIVNKMCQLGLPQCNDWAKVVFETLMNQAKSAPLSRNGSKFPDSMKYIVFCSAISTGGTDNFFKLRNLYFSPNTSRKSQALIVKCLTCTSSSQLIYRVLEDTINQEDYGFIMNEVDAINVWKHFSLKPQASDTVFEFLRMNWEKIYDRFRHDLKSLQEIVLSVAETLTKPIHLTDLALLKNHWKKLPNSEELLSMCAQIVSKNCDWRKSFLPGMSELFFKLASSTGKTAS